MEEIFRICDNITILRDGTYIGTESLKEISEEKVVEMMTGKSIDNLYLKDEVVVGETVLEVENLSRKGEFENISFSVKAGEVLGFAGLMGSGRSEIMHAIFGSKNLENGKIFINGKEVLIKNPLDAKNHGIGFVTEDRKEEGLILDYYVRDNIAVPSLKKFINKFIVNEKKIDTVVDDYIKKLKIKVFNSNQKVKSLSGGNQQKIVFAKWLETSPKILIL
ncbi:MAG: ATP-binding cassette domain-containing protein, partial [Cetobacterium sp.]